MPVYSRTITVNTDIESAFNFTADFRNLDKWKEGDDAELITKEPLGEGSVFKVKTHFNNREMVLDYEIIEWGAPLRASLRTETNNFEIVGAISGISVVSNVSPFLTPEPKNIRGT